MVLKTNNSKLTVSLSALLAPYLPYKKAKDMLRQALKLVDPISDMVERDRVLLAIATEWPAESLSQAIAFSSRLDGESSRINFLGGLVSRLEHDQLASLVAVAESIVGSSRRARIACLLAPYVSDDLVPKILDLLMSVKLRDSPDPATDASLELEVRLAEMQISDERERKHIRHAIKSRLRERILRESQIIRYETENYYSATIVALAHRLERASLGKALDMAQEVTDPLSRLKIHVALLPRLSDNIREGTLKAIFKEAGVVLQSSPGGASDEIKSSYGFMECLEVFADLLFLAPGDVRSRGVRIVAAFLEKIGQEWDSSRVESVLHRLPGEVRLQLLSQILSDLLESRSSAVRIPSLISLVLSGGLNQPEIITQLLAVVGGIDDALIRIRSTAPIIPYLGREEKKDAVSSVLRFALGEIDDAVRVTAIAQIAALIEGPDHGPLLDDAIMIAATIPSAGIRCEALTSLLSVFRGDRRHRLFADALSAAQSLGRIEERYRALAALIPIADRAELVMILDEVGRLNSDILCAQGISVLSPQLPTESIPKALSIVHKITSESDRVDALSALCPRLSLNTLDDLAKVAITLREDRNRVTLLKALMLAARQRSRMPGGPSMPFREWADDLERSSVFDLLEAATWWIAELSGTAGLIEISDAILDVTLWWP
jgi:hypothetical protein